MASTDKVNVYIEKHGHYQTTVERFDQQMERYSADSVSMLKIYLNTRSMGETDYSDLTTRTECLMVLAEYDGLATN